ncbi:uncharacterized protein I303_100860 [Kwoniella dejecticola CBS 10117]|uniref:Capsular associated protein n=1 Tax=Kwoniella dejecticola CBS 10117 TaxID=1296121 RepID=A0AAJ8KIJ5_9TREE
MDKRISSPFSQALYAVEVLTDRIKNLGRTDEHGHAGARAREMERDQEDSYRLLSWRNSIHEPSRNIALHGERGEGAEEQDEEEENTGNREEQEDEDVHSELPPPYDTDEPISPTSPTSPISLTHLPRRPKRFHLDLLLLTIVVLGIGIGGVFFIIFPFPTTIPPFICLLTILVGWVTITWLRTIYYSLVSYQIIREKSEPTYHRQSSCISSSSSSKVYFNKFGTTKRTILLSSTFFLIYLAYLGLIVPQEEVPPLNTHGNEKYFIAANLHDSEDILPSWSAELVKLIDHLGHNNVYVSIYESNSHDSTKSLLSSLNQTLSDRGVTRRIITAQDDKHWWPYNTSPERIGYLANARNKALEPIQSTDESMRLSEYQDFTKIIFLNDVFFTWKSIVRLIATKVEGQDEYDQVCALDFGTSGLYDTWASRDICGTPLRPFWPYVKDQVTIEKIEKEEPFEVSSCWNGAVVFKAGPFLYKAPVEESIEPENPALEGEYHLMKRGWKMVDDPTYPNSVFSPALTLPIQFRTSNISACDHSECFLIGYDLHRLYDSVERPPRIYMNPTVKLAYEKNWFVWHNKVLRVPVIQWWLENWSRGYPFYFVDWIWEKAGRRRDYCTWSALAPHLPERCPSLPGPQNKHWDE